MVRNLLTIPAIGMVLHISFFHFEGIQQTPAVGRAISEMIIDGECRTIDLTRFGFDRILVDQPLFEANIVWRGIFCLDKKQIYR